MLSRMLKTAARAMVVMMAAGSLLGVRAQAQELNAAGATFPQPLYQKWFQVYKNKTGVEINYQGIGSGGGIKNITAHAVDFGASDAPMTEQELAKAPGILHIPTVAGAVVVAYHVPGVGPGIRLTGPVIADMFLGKIARWNDPRITSLNPGTKFPALKIVPFHRSDASGTNNAFTTYLSQVSGTWQQQVGAGKSVKWPLGLGGKGNPGVAALLKESNGSIGYIELAYAVANNIPYAAVRNASGRYIYPSVKSTTVAASGVVLPPDFRKVITNTTAPQGYPITSFTYLLVFKQGTKPAVKQFLEWALTKGQAYAPGMYYAPLPPSVRKRALAAVASIQ